MLKGNNNSEGPSFLTEARNEGAIASVEKDLILEKGKDLEEPSHIEKNMQIKEGESGPGK